jgi:simple sugar transport system permease protein
MSAGPGLGEDGAVPLTVAGRLSEYLRGGGVITPLLTAIVAFFVGGLVVLVTGHNPFSTYSAIFNGTGLDWLEFWRSSADRTEAAINLQQTLIATTPLILTGLAVAFAFRCGLFNIGGQGQYLVGSYFAVWVGSSFAGLNGFLHVVLTLVLACVAAAGWGAIAGVLKAVTGASEVITTIMLNWTAVWIGFWLFGLGGPLQSSTQHSVPISNDIVPSVHLPVFWGDPQLQGLHVGLFIALAALVVFWVLLNRTRLGYEVRAVGFNPEASRTAGIPVARKYIQVMAICGLFAGLGGALDVLGWQFRVDTNDIQVSQIGFLGIAVALLGRNTAVGTMFAALLFGALVTGTSVRNLDPNVFQPDLANNLTYIIQGLVVLFVSADVLVTWIWRGRGRARRKRPAGEAGPEQQTAAVEA